MAVEGTTTPEDGSGDDRSHWVRWHEPYEHPGSGLSVRLGLVQAALRRALDTAPAGPLRIVSLCAGQGRDVIDVVANHRRAADVSALLVELDPDLVAFARARAEAAGVAHLVTVAEGDAARCHHYAPLVPADVVLVCGLFGNISVGDIARTIDAMPSFCTPGASVIWTRHRRPPDVTPQVREAFVAAGFAELSFEAPPDPYVLTVGQHRFDGLETAPFDPQGVLFTFIGDGSLPA